MPVAQRGERSFTMFRTNRLEALSDGIFAFAMTLLVLSISLPALDPDDYNNDQLHEVLLNQWRQFFNYFLAFMLLAGFWLSHTRQFHVIRATEHAHLWINIAVLGFVALVPFSTSLVGDYSNDPVSWLIFGLNIFIVSALLSLNWLYATHNRRLLEDSVTREEIELGRRRGLVVPLVGLLSIGVAFVSPGLAGFTYLLIPLVLLHPYFRKI